MQGDIDQYMKNVQKFQDKYGIEVRVDNEGWEDVRPKAAVAANTGAGPDIILSTNDDANLYPDKLVDVTDVCNYLGKQVRRLVSGVRAVPASPTARSWIGVPLGVRGQRDRLPRRAMLKAAGFDSVPKDTDGFLKLCKALKAKGTPGGFALGNATGDGNTWCHWLVWALGGKLVDAEQQGRHRQPGDDQGARVREGALRDVRARHAVVARPEQQQGVPRRPDLADRTTASRSITRRRTRQDPKVKEMAADIHHANFPVGPVGRPTEFNLFFNQMIFKYTKYPKAAKEFLRFMMEDEQIRAVGAGVASAT